MTFTQSQVRALEADLLRSNVKTRKQSGLNLSYIEGWYAISEANRIFGFDGWQRQTLDLRMVSERPREIGDKKKPGWGVSYVARVRVTAIAGDREIIRDGTGSGHGIDVDCGLAHESAIKEAETDAMKRAFMTFGNPFGLALYDKEQRAIGDAPEVTDDELSARIAAEMIAKINACKDAVGLSALSTSADFKAAYRDLPDAERQHVKDAGKQRKVDINNTQKDAA